MLPEPQSATHNKPHSIATDVRPFDLGYAHLYSRWTELYIYLLPIALILSALVGFLAFKAGVSTDTTLVIIVLTLIVSKAAFYLFVLLQPVYQSWRSEGSRYGARTTAHIFTADGVGLESASGPTLLPWKSISKVVETKKGFLFYSDGKVRTFLPTRNLEGPAEAVLIRKFIARN